MLKLFSFITLPVGLRTIELHWVSPPSLEGTLIDFEIGIKNCNGEVAMDGEIIVFGVSDFLT